jgi:HEAT repeat protein
MTEPRRWTLVVVLGVGGGLVPIPAMSQEAARPQGSHTAELSSVASHSADSNIPADVKRLTAALQDADPQVRVAAAKSLRPHRKHEAVEIALTVATTDKDKAVRAAARASVYSDEDREAETPGYRVPTNEELEAYNRYSAKLAAELLERLVHPGTCDRVRVADQLRLCAPCDPSDKARNEKTRTSSYLGGTDTRPDTWQRLSKSLPSDDRVGRGLLALALKVKVPEIKDAVAVILRRTDEENYSEFEWLLRPLRARQEFEDATDVALHDQMKNGDVHQRRIASMVIARKWWMPPHEIQATLAHLARNDPDRHVRRNAVLAFTDCTELDANTRNALEDLLDDKDETVRRAVSRVLHPSRECLVEALRNTSAPVRVEAAIRLGDELSIRDSRVMLGSGEKKDPKLLAELNELVARLQKDPDPLVRGLLALGIVSSFPDYREKYPELKTALPLVLEAMEVDAKDPLPCEPEHRSDFRHHMIWLLGIIGPDAAPAVPLIMEILAEGEEQPTGIYGQGNEETDRAAIVVTALIGIGRPAIPHLKKALKDPKPVVRISAAMALAYIDPSIEEGLPILLKSFRGECWGKCMGAQFHRADAFALGALGHRALPKLLDMARRGELDKSGTDQPFSFPWSDLSIVLSAMKPDADKVVPLLLETLKDPNEHARILAALGLRYHAQHADTVLPPLKAATEDTSPHVRSAAEEAVRHIQYLRDLGGVAPKR